MGYVKYLHKYFTHPIYPVMGNHTKTTKIFSTYIIQQYINLILRYIAPSIVDDGREWTSCALNLNQSIREFIDTSRQAVWLLPLLGVNSCSGQSHQSTNNQISWWKIPRASDIQYEIIRGELYFKYFLTDQTDSNKLLEDETNIDNYYLNLIQNYQQPNFISYELKANF